MFGEGAEATAKKLLYEMMWNEYSPFSFVGMHPGTEGVGGGIIFNIGAYEMDLSAATKAPQDDQTVAFIALHANKYAHEQPLEKGEKSKEQNTDNDESKEQEKVRVLFL
jgi:hypothetical protein